MSWAAIGAAAAGAASTLLGGSGGDGIDVSENARLMNEQRAQSLQYERDRFKATSEGAKAGGYHPLYALGQPAFSPSVMAGQSDTGSAASAGLQAASAGLQAYSKGKADKVQAAERQALLAAEIKLKNAQAARELSAANSDYVTSGLALSRNQRGSVAANSQQDTLKAGAVAPPGTLIAKGGGMNPTDISGMAPVDEWEKYFDELGALEQGARNYYIRNQRWRKTQHAKEYARRAWLNKAKRENRYGDIQR